MQTQRANAPKRRAPWWLAGALAVALVAGGLTGWFVTVRTAPATSAAAASNPDVCSATTVANRVLPSIVTISASGPEGAGTGSGEIIRSDGYILTNNHVISIAAGAGGSVGVLFSDGQTAPATITGRDPQADLAVIKVNVSRSLPAIAIGSSSSVVVGQPVVVLGAPLGLSSTVTAGIVSATDRTIAVPGDNGQTALLVSAIQTDAAINPGNSGGAMTNCSSQLIGVPSAGATVPNANGQSSAGSVGLGFAIPSDFAKSVANEIIQTGTVTHAYFGIAVDQIPPSAAVQAGTKEGLYVAGVVPGGPAASAGLQVGDVITKINGKPATDPTQLEALTLTDRPGDKVEIEYVRDGTTATTTVTLGAQPSPSS